MLILQKSQYMGYSKKLLSLFIALIFLFACENSEKNLIPEALENNYENTRQLSQEFKDYWYNGEAEITSYSLKQERYGELRDGHAVSIFVTEDFLPEAQVKANGPSENNIPVMKLNQTKKYTTGIYPYSVMTSTFSPVSLASHAVKVSHSMQEWCGHVYVQLNNENPYYEVQLHSYFEGEADQKLSLTKTWMEDELWNLIRINPDELPTGDISIIPSFEFFRMSHQEIKAHNAYGKLMQGDSISSYTLAYEGLKRELTIYFTSTFPYAIERWEEIHPNGLKSSAEKLKRIKSDYWTKNSTEFEYLRDTLLLK